MVDAINVLRKSQVGPKIEFPHGVLFKARIGRDIARLLAESNDELQRKLRRAHVERYKRDMHDGRFQPIMPIVVTEAGAMIDGQHRMIALSEVGNLELAFPVFIITSDAKQERAVRASIDIGASRTLADVARLAKYNLPVNLLVAYAMEIHDGVSGSTLTKSEIPALVLADPLVDFLAPIADRYKKAKAPAFAAFIRCARKNKKDAERFFRAIFAQEPTLDNEYSPLANGLIRWLAEPRSMNNKAQREMFSRTILVWNAWRSSSEPKRYNGRVPEVL